MIFAAALPPIVTKAIAWLTTLVLPIGARLLKYERFWPGWTVIKGWIRVGVYVTVFAGGVWSGVRLLSWYQGDVITTQEAERRALAQCQATIASANFKKREAAISEKEKTLDEREAEISVEVIALEKFERELETKRAQIPSGRLPVVPADDPWLRNW